MKSVDVLFINPYWSKLGESIEHMGFAYMAATLRKSGFSVVIADAPINSWNNEQTIENVKKYSPSIIGVSIPFQDGAEDAFELIKMLGKNFTCHISLGGIYPTFEYESILRDYPEIDSIVLGEGEETILDLTDTVKNNLPLSSVSGLAIRQNGKIIKTKMRPLVEDLDSLPFPERDTLPAVIKKVNFASIVSGRGCYGRCSFCSVDGFYSAFGPKLRLRSAKNVVDEMEMLTGGYNVHNFMFNDANFIGGIGRGKDRAFEIADEILTRKIKCEFRIQCRANDVDEDLFKKLKEAGLSRVYIGIESGSQPQLDRYRKDITVRENMKALLILRNLGLFAKLGFIMFDRESNLDDLFNNINFIKTVKKMFDKDKLGYIYPISKLMPLSGSAAKDKLFNDGLLKGNYKNFSYDFKDKKIETIYNMMKKSSSFIWGIKSKIKSSKDTDSDWTGGWTKWDEKKVSE
ncbi:MAG: radical SAM protein [Clostridiales bacterium]|nr:radical SAM protein [Clostridiales bacterium]